MTKRFSILCLTYKRPALLEEAIFSVLQQTHQNWELIVVNDCPEQTLAYPHSQVKIFNLKRKFKTLGEKRNFALEMASGDVVALLDDDDFFLPKYLETLSAKMGDCDWMTAQRIILWNDSPKITPVPIASTFAFRRNNTRYPQTNYDELLPFYKAMRKTGKGMCSLLPANEVGYVARRSHGQAYSMFDLRDNSIEMQQLYLETIPCEPGDVVLQPQWKNDYLTLCQPQ